MFEYLSMFGKRFLLGNEDTRSKYLVCGNVVYINTLENRQTRLLQS